MAVVLKCPACEEKFRWDFAEQAKWPKACPMCGVSMGEEVPDDVIVMPALRGAATKANDALYRQMERGSEIRAQAAAEQLGVPVSEMSGMKITDMRTGVKEGEISAPSVVQNQAVLESGGTKVGFQSNGAEFASAVKTGPYPNAGANTMGALQRIMGRG